MLWRMALGERIKQRRLELGWTQDVLAQKAGISKGFLSDLENGKRGIGAETLLDIGRVLGVSLDSLMTGTAADEIERREIEIPQALAEFASTRGLSFRQTLTLLQMQRQIVARRTTAGGERTAFDWARFYESVQEFLK
jgi:transcriptional regulator with XRE-family HTH domain